MKSTLVKNITVIFCFLYQGVFSQKKETVNSLQKINDYLYASNVEVSNKQYIRFVEDLKAEKDLSTLELAQFDSLQWRSKECYNEPHVIYYNKHPAYENYPVVNISFDAAMAHCNWLTKLYNQDPKRKFKKAIFRLPTLTEREQAAQAGNSTAIFPRKETIAYNSYGKEMASFKEEVEISQVLQDILTKMPITCPIKSYLPNGFGLYNIASNVSEMTASNTSIKGGSWKDSAELLKIKHTENFDGKPKAYIGFRCFMEVLEK
jgi:formylglycine-generating enzyme required for sulfatase activity